MSMTIEQLRNELEGSLVREGEVEWDRARASWNLSVDQRPAAVLEAASEEDVQAGVRFAAEQGLRVAPQSTGHGSEALGPLENALLLKTSQLSEVTFDADTGVARAGAGALAGDLSAATGEHGRAAVLGFSPTVGATGLCLSGGAGWLSRVHGLACNNVVAMSLVLPSGESIRADHETNPDLFWALRGAGTRGGVVTSIEVNTHELDDVCGGALIWSADQMTSVLEQFLAQTESAPDSLSLVFRYLSVPDIEGPPPHLRGQRLAMIIAVNLGGEGESAELMAPLREGGAMMDSFAPIRPGDLVRVAGDPEDPSPARGAGFLLDEFDAEGARVLSQAVTELPLNVVEIRHLGAALSTPPSDAGALGALQGRYSFFAGGAAPTPEAQSAVGQALAQVGDQLASWRSQTVLLSSAPPGTDPAGAFDSATWERLQSVARTYDPEQRIQGNR
jgi:FAD/FMN-containing dehydrogenase